MGKKIFIGKGFCGSENVWTKISAFKEGKCSNGNNRCNLLASGYVKVMQHFHFQFIMNDEQGNKNAEAVFRN